MALFAHRLSRTRGISAIDAGVDANLLFPTGLRLALPPHGARQSAGISARRSGAVEEIPLRAAAVAGDPLAGERARGGADIDVFKVPGKKVVNPLCGCDCNMHLTPKLICAAQPRRQRCCVAQHR